MQSENDSSGTAKPVNFTLVRVLHLCLGGGPAAEVRKALASYERLQLVQVDSRGAMMEQLRQGCDLVITDVDLLGFRGVEAVGYIARLWPRLPVIVCTATGSERLAAQACRSGAADYLMLPQELDQLEPAIRRCLQRADLLQALELAAAGLRRQVAALGHELSECKARIARLSNAAR